MRAWGSFEVFVSVFTSEALVKKRENFYSD